jgi:hypothetical protein
MLAVGVLWRCEVADAGFPGRDGLRIIAPFLFRQAELPLGWQQGLHEQFASFGPIYRFNQSDLAVHPDGFDGLHGAPPFLFHSRPACGSVRASSAVTWQASRRGDGRHEEEARGCSRGGNAGVPHKIEDASNADTTIFLTRMY